MPTTCIFRGCGTLTQRDEWTLTPANVEIGDGFTAILTDDHGITASVSFTATAATPANVIAGLVAAWNASVHPLFAMATASDETTYMKVVSDTPGVPLATLTTSTTNVGGGAATQTLTAAHTQLNKGTNDLATPECWDNNAVPGASDIVIIPSGAPAILYGLNTTSVTYGSVTFASGHNAQVGRLGPPPNGTSQAPLHYWRMKTGALTIRGTAGLVAIDVDDSAISPVIESTGSASYLGVPCVNLKGTALATPDIRAGNTASVGIAAYPGDTATVTAGATVLGGSLETGSGVTWTASTITVTGEETTLHVRSNPGTIEVRNGATATIEAAVTTLNTGRAVRVNWDSGNITTINANQDGAVFDLSRTTNARAFTTANYRGSVTFNDPLRTLTKGTENHYGDSFVAEETGPAVS